MRANTKFRPWKSAARLPFEAGFGGRGREVGNHYCMSAEVQIFAALIFLLGPKKIDLDVSSL